MHKQFYHCKRMLRVLNSIRLQNAINSCNRRKFFCGHQYCRHHCRNTFGCVSMQIFRNGPKYLFKRICLVQEIFPILQSSAIRIRVSEMRGEQSFLGSSYGKRTSYIQTSNTSPALHNKVVYFIKVQRTILNKRLRNETKNHSNRCQQSRSQKIRQDWIGPNNSHTHTHFI